MPASFIKPAVNILTIALPAWVLIRVAINIIAKKPINWWKELLYFSFYAYALCVAAITVIPLPFTRFRPSNAAGVNLVPVRHTVEQFKAVVHSDRSLLVNHALLNILGNVALFVPLGILLPLLSFRFRSLPFVFFTAVLLSGGIEMVQFISRQLGIYRSADIDDIILNTFGAVIGYGIFKMFEKTLNGIYGMDRRMQHL